MQVETASHAALPGSPVTRVLWFTDAPLAAVEQRAGRDVESAQATERLLAALRAVPGLVLGIATAARGLVPMEFEQDGVAYFVVRPGRLASLLRNGGAELAPCREVVDRFAPDLVHVRGGGSLDLLRAQSPEAGEAAALLGRTERSRERAAGLAPAVPWHRVFEVLRPEFARVRWTLEGCARGRILVTDGEPEGLGTLLDACDALAARGVEVAVDLALEVPARAPAWASLRHRLRDAELAGKVRLLGRLSPHGLAHALQAAHLFVLPSATGLGSTTLCEAMSVGVPCVAVQDGDVASIVEDGWSGFLHRDGDAAHLAEQLLRLLGDDRLAGRTGGAARGEALVRHSGRRVAAQLLAAYRSTLGREPDALQLPR